MERRSIVENMFGMVRGKYIGEPPLYVETSLPPGMTNIDHCGTCAQTATATPIATEKKVKT